MPFGSKPYLILRINSSSSGLLGVRQQIPLQAPDAVLGADRAFEIEHDLMHRRIQRLPIGEEHIAVHRHRLAHIVMDVAVAEMAERHRPGARDHQLDELVRARDEFRHSRHGTATSCLMLPPSCFCTSLIISRKRHSSCACVSEPATHGVGDLSGLDRLAEQRLGERRQASAFARARQLEQHIPIMRGRSGSRVARHMPQARNRARCAARSRTPSASVRRRRKDARRRRARSRAGSSPANAVTVSAGLGKSRNTAAVMMPSVPSEPMKRSLRS